MSSKRKYPAGVQSFEKLRSEGFVYVDKTALIYKLVSEGGPYFFSRPRRFGKSLLISTLAAVFEGRKELFGSFTTDNGIEQPALYISQTDWRWDKYPVFRFDFSAGDLTTIEKLDAYIDNVLCKYEAQYGITPKVTYPNIRMSNLLEVAHTKTGKRCVVLVDEYDNFILHALGDAEKVSLGRSRFQDVFGPLKAEDDHLQFVFITGISKFSQMGIFSKLNNMTNISIIPAYDSLCGFSEEELTTVLKADITNLGHANGLSYEEQLSEVKKMYDGYHFSRTMTDMYNPYSLTNALKTGEVTSYWFDRGTSGAFIEMLSKMPPVDSAELEGIRLPDYAFDLPFESFDNPLPILYQSGYLTIREYSKDRNMYTLGFPNTEVRKGFAECLFRHVAGKQVNERQTSFLLNAYYDFRDSGDVSAFIESLQTFFAGVPYHLDNHNEHHYHAMLYTLLTSFGADIRAEEPSAKGRADIVLKMPKGIYIMELKYDDSAESALAQIAAKDYADKYKQDGREVICIGLSFSSEQRNIVEWKYTLAEK